MTNKNEIRFLAPDGRVMFTVPDEGSVLLCRTDGTRTEVPCRYLDDDHLMFGTKVYEVRELAGILGEEGSHCEPFPEKRVIWSDIDLDLKDWEDDLKEYHPELNEDELVQLMYETNAEYLEDERTNLNISCGDDIIAIADLGLWHGRCSGYRLIESGKICDCLGFGQDSNEWYVDRDGELRSTQIHHDGENRYCFRKFRESASYDDRDELLAQIYEGKATQTEIDRLTEKLGPYVAAVYGWQFPTDKEPVRVAKEVR